MKKFLSRILWFLAPILLLAYPLDLYFSDRLLQAHFETGEIEVNRDIYGGKLRCDVAVYGSSRAWVHFNSQMMEDSLSQKMYNFGIDGHNFWLQYLRHLEFTKRNPKPKTIILSLDAFSMQKRVDLYNPDQFLPTMLWNRQVYQYTHTMEGFAAYDYFVPLIRYAGQKDAIDKITKIVCGVPMTPIRQKGFAGMDMTWTKDMESALASQKKYVIAFHAPTMRLFERFVAECQKANIDLIFVYAPEYIQGQRFVANRQQMMDYYQKVAQANQIPFLDFSSDPICQQKSLFYNASHLNKTGADLFTQKLITRLKPILKK
ncbi:hypothetical protein [Flavobacterium sp.]|uniref:hypothetical protein n=1 Tax=Flavobacterium sp. TaxID=239 RepID=UPI0039E3C4C5